MRISRDVGLPIVKAFEGCLRSIGGGRFTTYHCPANVLTIGYGHTNLGGVPPKIKEGDIWTQQQCDDALAADMANFEGDVERVMRGINLSQNQFDALVDFDFNTGGLARSSIPAKIKTGRLSEVGPTLERWNKANGKVLAGLVRRRKADALLFDGKPDEALRVAGTHRAETTEMAREVEKPKPPAAEVVKRSSKEIGTIAGGATIGTAAQTTKPATPPPTEQAISIPNGVIVLGVFIVIVGIVLLVSKYKSVAADWA